MKLNYSLVVGIVLLGLLYFAGGVLGMMIQSAQPGITPIWPPSGIALAVLMIFGLHLWPGIIIGMLLIALYIGVPYNIALLAAFGSILEAVIPVLILQRLGFKRSFSEVRHVLQFLGFAAFLGPVFSATTGTVAFTSMSPDLRLPWSNIWFLWWLGNSLGILSFAAFILAWWKNSFTRRCEFLECIVFSFLMGLICYYSFSMGNNVLSTQLLYLATPVMVLAGVRCQVKGVTLLGMVAVTTFMLTAIKMSADVVRNTEIGFLYTNLAFLGLALCAGLFVSAAFSEAERNKSD